MTDDGRRAGGRGGVGRRTGPALTVAPPGGPVAQSGLGRLAGWCHDHRRRVVVLWIVAVVAVIALAQGVGSRFDNDFSGGGSPSQQAQDLLASRFPSEAGDTADVVLHSSGPVDTGAHATTIRHLAAALRPLANVSGVRSPLAPTGRGQVSADGRTAFVVVQFDTTADHLPDASVRHVVDVARSFARPGLEVAVGGGPVENVVTAAPGSSEGIGITAAILIMLLAFGSVVAMGLPILTALLGVGLGFGVVDLVSHLVVVPTFGPELMAMIGLGVGIDYALFIVTRFRQGLAEGRDPRSATVVALSTAGRAVLFAGCTVVIALLGLFVVGLPFMDGLAVGTILAVLLVLAGALTLVPALLGFAGPAIDRLHIPGLLSRAHPVAVAPAGSSDHSRPPEEDGVGPQARSSDHSRPPEEDGVGPPARSNRPGFWYRWSRTVQRRPWTCGGVALAVLVLLAVPFFSMRLAFTDAGNDPPTLTTRQAYDLLAEGFGPGFNGPLVLVADLSGPAARTAVGTLDSRLRTTPGVASVEPALVNPAGDAAVIIVYPTTGPQAAQTSHLVHHLRDQVVPQATAGTGATVYVGGETAAGVDASTYLAGRLPWVIALVIGLAFLLLMAVFRSVVVPVKAAVMNLLSMGAAYGVIVAVYQWGWLGAVFGVSRTGPIDPWIPLMMFTIVFGLSMDYEVFLLSRVREEWRRTGDNSRAVADGVATTARVITAAAAIMVCVFGSFVINDPLRVLGVFGLGLAAAIFVDATLVRMVLVPAVMQVLGSANWWLPRWLDRLVPTLGVEVDLPSAVEVPVPEPVGPRTGDG